MTGPEHYRAAETMLRTVEAAVSSGRAIGVADMNATIAVAQVHATLALAAATAQDIRRNNAMDAGLVDDWIEVSR